MIIGSDTNQCSNPHLGHNSAAVAMHLIKSIGIHLYGDVYRSIG